MSNKKSVFYPQLDSLRAFAVILVIISHWFSRDHVFNRYSSNGILGVTLFFVLSGFLITGILLRNKIQIEEGEPLLKAYKIFYIRRSLRIFPIYYVLLITLGVLGLFSVRESFWWHFFYSSNFYFWIQGKFSGLCSHLWSLSVEEQFYLLWPAVIFFVPKRYLQGVFITGIIAAILFRYFISTPQNDIGRILMPGSLDSFCIGGLFAYGRQFDTSLYNRYLTRRNLFVFLSFVLLVLVHSPLFKKIPFEMSIGLFFFLISISFGVFIDRVADSVHTPIIKNILSSRVLLYIGKISYGVYLFHNFIPHLYGIEFPRLLQPFSLYLVEGLRFILLIALATVSWFFIEKRVLKLKDRFEYDS